MSKSLLKAAGILVGGYLTVLGSCRMILDLTDELEFREDCVKKIELEGLTDYFVFQHCEDGDSRLTYSRDNPYTKTYTLIDINNDNLPDILQVEDKEYFRDRNPRVFEYADKRWRRYCDSIDCEKIVNDWLRWKRAAKKV